jgi:hypothetical protein
MVIVGLIGILVSFFMNLVPFIVPVISPHKTIIQIISISLLVIGIWFEGFNSNNKIWEAKIKDLQTQIVIAERKSSETNVKIEYVYVDRVETIKEIQTQVATDIRQKAPQIDRRCESVSEAINILNSSAKPPSSKK